jgi:hypothetical protein
MTTYEMEGLVGEDEHEVPYGAASYDTEARRGADRSAASPRLAGCVAMPKSEGTGRVLEPEIVARRQPGARVLINGRFEVEITLHRHKPARGLPLWIASALLATPRGPMQWSASATEHEIARRLAAKQGIVGFDLGQLFGGSQGNSNRRATQRGAQGLAFQRVVGDVRRTLDSPAGQAITTALSAVPYVGPAVQGLRAATTLVDNVANGNPRSRANLARLQRAARRGDPRARQAVGVVENVLRAQRRMTASRAQAPEQASGQGSAGQSSEQERAWSEADRIWNAYRAARAREGLDTPDPAIAPLITPPPAQR